jgi:hypothetical protein
MIRDKEHVLDNVAAMVAHVPSTTCDKADGDAKVQDDDAADEFEIEDDDGLVTVTTSSIVTDRMLIVYTVLSSLPPPCPRLTVMHVSVLRLTQDSAIAGCPLSPLPSPAPMAPICYICYSTFVGDRVLKAATDSLKSAAQDDGTRKRKIPASSVASSSLLSLAHADTSRKRAKKSKSKRRK